MFSQYLGQQPFAAILSCADSRVVPELVFDVGIGDLFTCRIAGTVLSDAVIGSIETGRRSSWSHAYRRYGT